MKTVIMAGGKGTRISSIAKDIPKPMLPVGEVPVLEREINSLRDQGFDDIIITVGHLGQVITDYFGDGQKSSPVTGKPFGVHIEYFVEETPLGNAGALFHLREKLTDDFLLLNGDVIFDLDFQRMVEFHRKKGGLVTLLAHPNSHPYDSGLIISDRKSSAVLEWLNKEDKRPEFYQNRVNAGIHVISRSALDMEITSEKVDLDRQILRPLAGTGRMFVYDSPEYVKDMGTPERYADVCRDFRNGVINAKNLRNQQKAIFLDRDGTINKYVGFLKNIDDFELLCGVPEAIRMINNSGYLAIVVTNQPVVARGEITLDELYEIHNKMETLLGYEGAYLDGIYFCPHHPDKGFEGEIPELKIECSCRKPKPGLIFNAAHDYHIDLSASWMIGDRESDIRAGLAAGCRTALIGDGDYGQDLTVNSLLNAICLINNNL